MLTLFSVSISFAQKLQKHQWNNRVLIVAAKNQTLLQQQIELLNKDLKGLQERKLVIYKVLPEEFSEGIENEAWISNSKFYANHKKTEEDLEIILIGLDGGVKLRQTKLLTLEKLFALIDGMPMRKAELRKN
jgi:hypothetical protein